MSAAKIGVNRSFGQHGVPVDDELGRLRSECQRLAFALQTGELGIIEAYPSGAIRLDDMARRAFAIGGVELTIDSLLARVDAGDRESLRRGLTWSSNAGSPFSFTLRTMGEGTERIVEMRGARCVESSCILAVVWDATRTVRAREAVLRGSEARLRAAVEAASSAMAMVDGAGGIRLYNAEFAKLFGYSSSELDTLSVDQLVAPDHVARHQDDRSRYLAHPTRRPMGGDRQLYGRHKSGRLIPLEIGLNPLELDGERLTLVSIVDITERLLAREAIAFRERHLLSVNESLSEFAYAASHDLQEPMRKVAGFCQLLETELGEGASDRARQYIGFAIDASVRMQALVRDLLEYSRVSEAQHALSAVSADDCARSAVELLADVISQTRSIVRLEPLPRVRAHPVLLGQVFNNLIGNAIKYRSPDRTAEVVVSAKPDGAVWRFQVSDNGIGIDSANYERVFRVFQRLHGRDAYPGTGIGLAVVKRAVERCGGRIWLDSELGRGTSVLFTLEPAPAQ